MNKIEVSAFDIAQRFVGTKEVSGATSNPQILAMLRLDDPSSANDEIPWCSAFVNYVAWILRLPRSKNLLARSWLTVGVEVPLDQAEPGFDVAIFKRGLNAQPGPDVINAPGHVGFFAGISGDQILVLGGNQGDSVSVAGRKTSDLLGVRRLA